MLTVFTLKKFEIIINTLFPALPHYAVTCGNYKYCPLYIVHCDCDAVVTADVRTFNALIGIIGTWHSSAEEKWHHVLVC